MTRDVSADYDRWAHGDDHAAAFSADSPFGGDHDMVRSGRIDPGRAELDRAVNRQLAQTGGTDYDSALTVVLSQARTGVIALSQQALEGTGIRAMRAGRGELIHDAHTGEVVMLAGAPTSMPLGEPPIAEQDTPRFRDAVAYCVAQRPGQTVGDAATQRLIERCDPGTANRQINEWVAAGGGKVAGVRFG